MNATGKILITMCSWSCASEDGALGYSILKLLEENRCKVCYHKKDFIPGESISDNIIQRYRKKQARPLSLDKELHQERLLFGGIQSIPPP